MPNPPATGVAPQQTQGKPLRYNTRQRVQKVGTMPITGFGQQLNPLTFPQVGLINRIFLHVQATVSDAAASPSVAAAPFGPWNIIKRATFQTNLGTANIFDCSGYGTRLSVDNSNTDVSLGTANAAVASDPFFQYPTSGFVQNTPKNVSFVLVLRIGANDGRNWSLGMLNLQAPEIRAQLLLTTGVAADAYTTADTLTLAGNVQVYYEYYEVPAPGRGVALPPPWVHRIIEDRQTILANGDVLYTVPRQGKLLRMMHTVSVNNAIVTAAGSSAGSGASGITSRRLVVNKTDTIYNQEYIVDRILERIRYGHLDLPMGTFIWDFFIAEEDVCRGDFRDVIDTEAISTLESFVTLDSGVTITGACNLDTVREIIQPMRQNS